MAVVALAPVVWSSLPSFPLLLQLVILVHCHHHCLPIRSPQLFVDCCANQLTQAFVKSLFAATVILLLPLPCTVYCCVVVCCHWCHCRLSSVVVSPPFLPPLAGYKGWLLLFRQGLMASVLVVLPVCGTLSSTWSLCPWILIIVNRNQVAATPLNNGPQPPTSPPPRPLLWLLVILEAVLINILEKIILQN